MHLNKTHLVLSGIVLPRHSLQVFINNRLLNSEAIQAKAGAVLNR